MEKDKTPQRNDKVVPLHPTRKKKKTTLFYTILAVVVVCLCVYEVFKINYSPVETEVAFQKTVYNTASCEGFVVRDETPIKTDTDGTLVPLVVDGRRVARGDAVAVVFKSEEAAKAYTRIEELKQDIAYFESLKNKVGSHTSDMEAMDERVYTACESYVRAVSYGKNDQLSTASQDICEAITSRQLATGTVIDPTEKIAALKAELAELQKNSGGYTTIYAPNPGYYISHVDGYETALSYEKATTASDQEITSLFTFAPQSVEERKGYMGKLVDGFSWYLYCVIPAESAGSLAVGQHRRVDFPLSNAESVEAEVVAVHNMGDGKTAVTLRSNLMNSQYAGLRKEQVRLVLDAYTGFQISNRAIREVNGEKGVFVVSGNLIKFKKVDIAFSDANYSLCVTPLDDNGNPQKGYVELYDEVVIEGTDLYDGKVLG